MNKLAGVLAGLLVPAFVVAGAIATPAMAQEKKAEKKMAAAGKPVLKELEKNDKVLVIEATFKPGDASGSVARPPRVVRALTSASLQRIYPDGKKEAATFKNGEVKYFPATDPYIVKNVGKNTVRLYVVNLVEAKK